MLKYRLNPHLLFDSTAISLNLATKSVRGGVITMASTILMFVINMGQTIILARLLTPEDYGIVGMVAVIIGIVALFKDAGLSMATVQQEKITSDQISTLFWINLLISVVFGLIIVVSAPLIAWFYKKPQLIFITVALSISFMIGGISIQHNALLKRHMRFDLLTIITIASALISLAVSIVLAILGFQYWALIIGSITLTLSEVLLTLSLCPWMPGKWKRNSGARVMFKFGMHVTGSSFANYFSRNADNFLIGKFIGAEGLGLYNKAYQLFMMPIGNIRNPINQVAVPALSALQKEPDRYQNYFYRITDILATFTFPFAIYLYFEASFLINLMYGNQWIGAIPAFKMLAIGGLIQAVASQRGLVMITTGQSSRFLNWAIFYAVVSVTSFAIGLPYGIEGVAGCYAIAEYIVFIPSLFYCYQNSPINPMIFLKKIAVPLLVGLIAGIAMESIKFILKENSLLNHIVYLIVFTLVFSGLTWFRKDFITSVTILINEYRKKK